MQVISRQEVFQFIYHNLEPLVCLTAALLLVIAFAARVAAAVSPSLGNGSESGIGSRSRSGGCDNRLAEVRLSSDSVASADPTTRGKQKGFWPVDRASQFGYESQQLN